MVQAVIRHHDGYVAALLPRRYVRLDELEFVGQVVRYGELPATFQHAWIDVQATKTEILQSLISHFLRQSKFGIAVTGSDAYDHDRVVWSRFVRTMDVFEKEVVNTGDTQHSF